MKNSHKRLFDTFIVAIVFGLLFFINIAKFLYRSFHPRSMQHFRVV